MHSDEELKDGRYFPSPKEQAILTQTIDKYFKLPERSEQRSIVVQNVTAKLSEINSRWNHRAVRLWFNNNKRTCMKTSVQFDPMQIHGSDLAADRMPPKKRPPRSSSVGSYVQRPLSPPADINISNKLASVFTAVSQQRQSLDEKKAIETNLTNVLIEISNKLWNDHIAPIDHLNSITSPDALSCSSETKSSSNFEIPQTKIIQNYNSVETGILFEGKPAVIDFISSEQVRSLTLNQESNPEPTLFQTPLPFQASSMIYDPTLSSFFVTSGSNIYSISSENGETSENLLTPGVPPMLRSSLCFLEDGALVLGSRRLVHIWSRDQINQINNGDVGSKENNSSGYFVSGLPSSITSIAPVNSMIAACSNNHHAIYLLTPDGRNDRTFIGHGSGVTCLYSNDCKESIFISGSVDFTARVWDCRVPAGPIFQLQRHHAPLSVVSIYKDASSYLAFSGGEDHVVKIWDLREKKVLNEVYVGMGIPIDIDYDAKSKSMMVLTKEKCGTAADGFLISQPDESGKFIEKSFNLCIHYNFNT